MSLPLFQFHSSFLFLLIILFIELNRARDRHIRWAIEWITQGVHLPKVLKVAAARELAGLAWPEERIPGLRGRLWITGAAFAILSFARRGEVLLCREVDPDEVEFNTVVGKGAVGTVYQGEIDGQTVAVKVTKESNIAFVEEEFFLEVALMCTVNHSSILSCIGAFLQGPDYFFISPFQGS